MLTCCCRCAVRIADVGEAAMRSLLAALGAIVMVLGLGVAAETAIETLSRGVEARPYWTEGTTRQRQLEREAYRQHLEGYRGNSVGSAETRAILDDLFGSSSPEEMPPAGTPGWAMLWAGFAISAAGAALLAVAVTWRKRIPTPD